jgi:hypothetical protein
MKRSISLLFLAFSIALAPSLQAALEKDLGQALAYLRVTEANDDAAIVVQTIDRHPALVLDLRSVPSADGLAARIKTALAKPPAPHALRIILINATTAPALVAATTDSFQSVITIGPKSPAIAPDIAVTTSEEEDRRAFTALATGTAVDKLITDNREKRRYDEARLVQDHANGVTPPDSVLPADADDDSVTTEPPPTDIKLSNTDKKVGPVPPIDVVLERAIQLHRSLLALKKL